MSFRRLKTTLSAAAFSATKSTVLPSASASATRFAIVWLLPVPGGPTRMKFLPDAAARTAASCDESAGSGQKSSSAATFSSSVRTSGNGIFVSNVVGASASR